MNAADARAARAARSARALLTARPGSRSSTTRRSHALPDRARRGRAATRSSSAASGATRRTRAALNLWVVCDNLLKGAATNAVQIAEVLHERGLIRSRAAAAPT